MTTINITNTLVSLENALCIYRNYSFLKRRVTYLVIFRIFVETSLILLSLVFFALNSFEGISKVKLDEVTYVFTFCYLSLVTVNSLAAMFLSYSKSNHFKEFVCNVDAVHKLFENNMSYQFSMKKHQKRFYIDLSLFTFAILILTSVFIYDTLEILDNICVIIIFVIEFSLEFRFYCENFIFYEFIEVIVVPLKFLNGAVSAAVKRLLGEGGDMEYDDELRGMRGELEKWGKACRLLVAAGDRFSDCFGAQVTLYLFSATFNYIILLYQGISYIVNKQFLVSNDIRSVSSMLILYTVATIALVTAGQRALNQADRLERNLTTLNLLLVAIPGGEAAENARAAAALARRLRAAPLRVRLLSSRALQVALLADMFAVAANYTIILLQFNHVV